MTGTVFIGTAGWSIASQYSAYFPDTGSHLERYATRFNATEINSSFYRPHRRATYARWAASVPEDFCFSVKLPRSITHERRLTGCVDLLSAFGEQVSGLGAKLGVILVQLPPNLGFDPVKADGFLTMLRTTAPAIIACEPRHPSWFSPIADALLRDHGVTRVAADPAPVPGAEKPGGSTGACYVRLHGSPVIYRSAYGDAQLSDHAAMVAEKPGDGPAWCIFDNTAGMAAIGDALRFRRIIGQAGSSGGTPPASDR